MGKLENYELVMLVHFVNVNVVVYLQLHLVQCDLFATAQGQVKHRVERHLYYVTAISKWMGEKGKSKITKANAVTCITDVARHILFALEKLHLNDLLRHKCLNVNVTGSK